MAERPAADIGVLRELGMAEEQSADPAAVEHLQRARTLSGDVHERSEIALDLARTPQSRGPQLFGDICLRNSNAQARVILEYRDNNHVPVTTVQGPTVTGTGAPLDVFPVVLIGPPVSSVAINHLHARLQDNRSGALSDVATAVADF